MAIYAFTLEQNKERVITTVEEAKSVIIATATVRMHDYVSISKDAILMEVMNIFNIPLLSLVIRDNPDHNDFPYLYEFYPTVQEAHIERMKVNKQKATSLYMRGKYKEVCEFVSNIYGHTRETSNFPTIKEEAEWCLKQL